MKNLDKNKVNSNHFTKNDFDYLAEIKKIMLDNPNPQVIQDFLKKHYTISINGVLRSLELDLEGFFSLGNSEFKIHAIKSKLGDLSKEEIFTQIIERIESIKEGDFDFSESLYEIRTIKIEYDGNQIPVTELLSEPFGFILYQTCDEPFEYYLEIVQNGLFVYTTLHKVKEKDNKIVKSLDINRISTLCRKYS